MNDVKYIGLDLHQATISVVVLDSTGRVPRPGPLPFPDRFRSSTPLWWPEG